MSATPEDGGPAFPVTDPIATEGHFDKKVWLTGMSLRDWFAGQALAGLCTVTLPHRAHDLANVIQAGGIEARAAYALADAMLSARGGRDG